ncbi:MAG: acyl-CoA dehydrogenase family protein [Desulfosarcina sp.]|nr:acyl-CoA dehydrogenase family protein [Desulfobacterales bacterium]
MEFEFTKEQRQVGNAVRDFARKELRPLYTQLDREKKFPRDIWKKIGQLGLIGMCITPENGGLGSDYVSQGVAAEEMAREDPNMCSATFAAAELCVAMMEEGTQTVKKSFLEPVMAGEMVPAFALTEPHCGTDAAAISATARKKGSSYIINGEKTGITLMGIADVAIVIAKTDAGSGA